MDSTRKHDLLIQLIRELAVERGQVIDTEGFSTDELFQTFRAFVNTRPPEPATAEFFAAQDELLQGMIAEAGVHSLADSLPAPEDPHILLWRGDITTLATDAIVNAANSQMLGCWVPGHYCIDNAIHTFAGIQLRRECAELMEAQGHEEPTGSAKVTDAWNLPCKRIIHTVGPIAAGHPSGRHRIQLAQCYTSCLDAAEAEGLTSIAFCCISTGVFGFPAREAAGIAVRTVRNWLSARPGTPMRVVFNVFLSSDEDLYRLLLGLQ